jgi:hypothetical protein
VDDPLIRDPPVTQTLSDELKQAGLARTPQTGEDLDDQVHAAIRGKPRSDGERPLGTSQRPPTYRTKTNQADEPDRADESGSL